MKKEMKENLSVVHAIANEKKIDNLVGRCVDILNTVKNDVLSFCIYFADAYMIDKKYAMNSFMKKEEFSFISSWAWTHVILPIGLRSMPSEMFWLRDSVAKHMLDYMDMTEVCESVKGHKTFFVYDRSKHAMSSVRLADMKERHAVILIDDKTGKFRSPDEQKEFVESLPKRKSLSKYSICAGENKAFMSEGFFTIDELQKIIDEIKSGIICSD